MKKTKFKIMLTMLTLTAGIIVGATVSQKLTVGTSAVTPGTVSDPVVTKSYVDEQIKKALAGGSNSTTTSSPATSNGSQEAQIKVEVVSVNSGQTLMLLSGSEAVVRAGKGIAYSTDTNGLSDLTDGKDISPGHSVPSNHLIWFPRDGRGITADPNVKSSLTVLVKGPYYIQ